VFTKTSTKKEPCKVPSPTRLLMIKDPTRFWQKKSLERLQQRRTNKVLTLVRLQTDKKSLTWTNQERKSPFNPIIRKLIIQSGVSLYYEEVLNSTMQLRHL
jgi:hypothetical protein